MKHKYYLLTIVIFTFLTSSLLAQKVLTMALNGTADFEQTTDAYPPKSFTRKIPVPGLIDLATPKTDEYDKYFDGTYTPKYNWYRFNFKLQPNQTRRYAILKMLKSRFSTVVYLNGYECGSYKQNNTPIDCNLTPYINKTGNNELLIRVADRPLSPTDAATGYDREKYTNIAGIWDDIKIDFMGPVVVHRALVLPNLEDEKVQVKVRLENHANILERNMEYSDIDYELMAYIVEKKSRKVASDTFFVRKELACQNGTQINFELKIKNPKSWSPDHPFLYEAVIMTKAKGLVFHKYGDTAAKDPNTKYKWKGLGDTRNIPFGMRDFKAVGKSFQLNGEEIRMFGSTIMLNRFFEDRNRAQLPWDTAWVKRLLITIPKRLNWNFMRVSIGGLPKFWYDLADEYGILIQNEYNMWNLRGRNEQYRQEYTDWIWADGNHPSIIIWDALNEQKQEFIGRTLIPELKKIDPTRIWDLGYMKADKKNKLDMLEIHWYPLAHGWWVNDEWVKKNPHHFDFGWLTKKYDGLAQFRLATTPIIVNEYGWLWQHRDGLHSGVRTYGAFAKYDHPPYRKNYEYFEPDGSQIYAPRDVYEYYLGKDASAKDRWHFQAYMLAIESEILRATGEVDGLASFSYLSNNQGYTGDWFKEPIKELIPTQPLLVQYHTTQRLAAFWNLPDARYNPKVSYYEPKANQIFPMIVLNDTPKEAIGTLETQLIDAAGKVVAENNTIVKIEAFWQQPINVQLHLPKKKGGYMLISKFKKKNSRQPAQVSRRYIQIGKKRPKKYFDYEYQLPKLWDVDFQ